MYNVIQAAQWQCQAELYEHYCVEAHTNLNVISD